MLWKLLNGITDNFIIQTMWPNWPSPKSLLIKFCRNNLVKVITLALDQSDHIKQLPLYYINQKKIQFSNILYYYALWYCLSCLRFAFRIQKIFSLNENKLPKYLYVLIIINLIVLNSSPMVLVLSPDSKMVRNIKIG
jgi:hypothetical protein